METIFKVGDKVFDIQFGWGEVAEYVGPRHFLVRFENSEVTYFENGSIIPSNTPLLSFTEYKLEGFSKERPANYDDYLGKWCMFWDDDKFRIISQFSGFEQGVFKTGKGYWYENFKPLTDEQIKALEL